MKVARELVCMVVVSVVSAALFAGCGVAESLSGKDASSSSVSASSVPPLSSPSTKPPSLFPVRQQGRWGFIDKTGQIVIDYQYDEAREFSEGLAAVRMDDEWGYVDESGKLVIPPRWYWVGRFSFGLAPVYTRDTSVVSEVVDSSTYIDSSGKVAIPPTVDWSGGEFSEGLAPVWFRGEGCGYIDISGELVLTLPEATSVRGFSEGLAAVRDASHRWGYVDREGQFVIEPQYSGATEFSDGLAVVEHVEYGEPYSYYEYEIIDKDGRVVKELDYEQVLGFNEGRAAFLEGGHRASMKGDKDPSAAEEGWWGYMDGSGDLAFPKHFSHAWSFYGGLARVEDENGKMAYIDLDGNWVWREE